MSRLFLKPASSGLFHHSYNPLSIGSLDFSDPFISRVIETLPSDNFSQISGSGEMQLAPQVFPPFGDLYFRTAAFSVPEHQIFAASEAFHSNQTLYKGRAFKLPVVRPKDILNILLRSTGYSTTVTVLDSNTAGLSPLASYPSQDDYDFIYYEQPSTDTNQVLFYFEKLTARGYRVYRFFKSLGYDFVTPPFLFYDTVPSGFSSRFDYIDSFCNYNRSALPFLAYLKVYVDYFMPGQFFNGSPLVEFLQSIHDNVDYYNSGVHVFDTSTGLISGSSFFVFIMGLIKTPVLQDMFTSAWNSPNSPTGAAPNDYGAANNGNIISPFVSPSSVLNSNVVQDKTNGVYSDSSYGLSPISGISSFGLKIQKAFMDFVVRNNLVGTRPVQRTLARFGIKPSDATSHFVSKLYEGSDRIKFHPVLSNASNVSSGTTTVGEGLGDIAGFSKESFNFSFDYKSSDYGFIIIVHWLQIKPILLHGQDSMTMRLNPFDWFTPEYDGEALRAIPLCEISTLKDKRSQTQITSDLRSDEEVYGFTNLYEDYRYMRDLVCGDFLNGFTKDFLFARDYSVLRADGSKDIVPQSNDVQLISGGGFTQPFQMSDSIADRFWLGIRFDISAERPVKTSSDALMLNGSGSVEIPLNGTSNS